MAKTNTAVAPRNPKAGAVTSWEQQMAAAAQDVAAAESKVGASRFFSTRAGILALGGNPLPDNRMDVVVLDSVFERAYYGGEAFDPENPKPPVCFAFSRTGDDMEPHDESQEKQHEDCTNCPHNKWGTAERNDGKKSKGKACKEIRRLGTIPSTALEDPKYVAQAEWGMLKVPVTSISGWANYVKAVAASYKRPPFGMVTQIALQPDVKTQFRMTFQALDSIKNNTIGQAILAKRDSILEEMVAPYQPKDEEEEAPKKPAAKRKFR